MGTCYEFILRAPTQDVGPLMCQPRSQKSPPALIHFACKPAVRLQESRDMMAVAASTAGGIHTPQAKNTAPDYEDCVTVVSGRKERDTISVRFEITAISCEETLFS